MPDKEDYLYTEGQRVEITCCIPPDFELDSALAIVVERTQKAVYFEIDDQMEVLSVGSDEKACDCDWDSVIITPVNPRRGHLGNYERAAIAATRSVRRLSDNGMSFQATVRRAFLLGVEYAQKGGASDEQTH